MKRDVWATLLAALSALAYGAPRAAPDSAQREAIFAFAAVESTGTFASPLHGRMAPDFALPDDGMNAVRLGELRGQWVVVHFYPAYDAPDCTCRASEFTRQLQAFHDLGGAIVLGISTTPPEQLPSLRKTYDLKLRLLSDSDKRVMKRYGAWAETTVDGATYGRVVRTTFVIAPDGRIRRHWPEVMPEGHAERVRSFIQSEIKGAQ